MAPQSDPEAIQVDMGRPFETYGIYRLGNKVGHKEWHRKLNFSLLAVLGVFFYWFCTAFLDFVGKRVSKMDCTFVGMATRKPTKFASATWCHQKLPTFFQLATFLATATPK